jgi:hypothetical protein
MKMACGWLVDACMKMACAFPLADACGDVHEDSRISDEHAGSTSGLPAY